MSEKKFNFALAGNPNCGKTTLFNGLTGSTAYVGNWPGVTVEKREGTYKSKKLGDHIITDLPGIYSLSPYSPEEVISRNYILESKPDCVINVIDATNLERNLYMTTQILEMDVPVVIALNMTDALEVQGQSIDAKALSKKLGVPVVSISALKREGLEDLMASAIAAATHPRKGRIVWEASELEEAIDKATALYKEEGIDNPVFHAVKALEKDEIEKAKNASISEKALAFCKDIPDFEAKSADYRYRYISKELSSARKGAVKEEKKKLSLSDKIDRILTNRWLAFPILIVLFYLIFQIVFNEDVLYLGAMGVDFGGGFEDNLIHMPGAVADESGRIAGVFDGLFYTEGGWNSLGVFLANLLNSCTGAFSAWIGTLIPADPSWVSGFICDGVLAGLFAVIGFLPQILLLFFFFSILEDSGYMPRVAFVLDRLFRRFGVSGRAFLPMIMGFGCGVPAMINTRTLTSDKERTKTIRVIPFFSCSAKLPILTAVAGVLASSFGLQAGLLTFAMYVLGVAMAILMVIVMNKTTQREKVAPFVMELPSYHLPQPRALGIHVWDKAKHFLKKAFTIILVTTILVWVFSSFTCDWQFIANYDAMEEAWWSSEANTTGFVSLRAMYENSILADLGKLIQPLFTPLGWGSQAGSNGWVYSVAAINGLIAKENVIGTLGTLGNVIGNTIGAEVAEGEEMVAIVANTNVTVGALVSFIIFNMLTIPCFASVATAKGEMPSRKAFLGTIAFWLLVSYLTACAFYLMIDFAWTIGIIVPLFILGLVGLYFYDRKKKKEEVANC